MVVSNAARATAVAMGLAVATAVLAPPAAAQAQSAPPATRLELVQAPGSPGGAYTLPNITYEELIGSPERETVYNPVVMGVGAVGGVLLFNAFMGAVVAPVAVGASLDSTLAASRVYAVGSAVAGAFIGQWIYNRTFAR
jgi:hypothetical protein